MGALKYSSLDPRSKNQRRFHDALRRPPCLTSHPRCSLLRVRVLGLTVEVRGLGYAVTPDTVELRGSCGLGGAALMGLVGGVLGARNVCASASDSDDDPCRDDSGAASGLIGGSGGGACDAKVLIALTAMTNSSNLTRPEFVLWGISSSQPSQSMRRDARLSILISCSRLMWPTPCSSSVSNTCRYFDSGGGAGPRPGGGGGGGNRVGNSVLSVEYR